LGPDQWPGPLPWSVPLRWFRTASAAAQTAAKTGETTGETGETTAGTAAAEPLRRTALRRATNLGLSTAGAYFRSKYLIVSFISGCDTLVM
jgi:hypothetical protein